MYYILLALTRPMHGYELMQEISLISRDSVKVGAGTMYALLTRFEGGGVVKRIADDGRRKTYALTTLGRSLLDREYQRLRQCIKAYDDYTKEGGEKREAEN
jgi:DNA-binding PadR family transcriptional regulator